MAYSYTTRDGKRVEVNVAAAFDRMAAAFRAATGTSLHVRSGTRTSTEQRNIFLQRYVTAGNINGRKVYDTRVWNGKRYYRISPAGTVAVPGTSNHEENGPNGPRSIDIYDSGSNAGVTSRGTTRDRWMQNNAGKYGFDNEGYNFGEPWHKTYRGKIGGGSASGGSSSGKLAEDGELGPATIKALQKVLGVAQDGQWGSGTTTALQKKLIALGHKISADGEMGPNTIKALQTYLLGGKKADGKMGPETIRGLQHYLNVGGKFSPPAPPKPTPPPATGGLAVDGELGPATVKKLQSVLGVSQDGEWGPATTKALQAKLAAMGHKISIDGDLGPATIKALQTFLLGHTKADGKMGPETIRGLQSYLNSGGKFVINRPDDPKPPATDRLTVDGEWGPATTKALQKKLGVTVDGEMGPNTIKALQKVLGQAQDGQLGSRTIKALQLNVGAVVDGALGPNTIKKLQEFLNDNKDFTAVIVDDAPVISYPKPAAPTYPGATWWNHSPNSTPRRAGDKVQYFVVHHAADTNSVETQRARFMAPNDRKVSPNWLIGKDGSVSEIVPPDKYRAWTTGQFDYNAVTVETQNSSGSPTWGITEASHDSIAKLVAWASKRYGFPIDRQHVLGHREVPNVPATACPGPSMDVDKIVTLAKKYAAETPTEPTPTTWKIEIPLDEAQAASKAIDEAIGILNQFRKLLP